MERLLKSEVTWCDVPLSRSQFRVLELFAKAKLVQDYHCGDNCMDEVGANVVSIIQ